VHITNLGRWILISIVLSTAFCQRAFGGLPSAKSLPQRGGKYITASGALNVLFVYVQFPDDNYLPSSHFWPKGRPPVYMNATIDSVWRPTATPGSFTDYFNQMSFNTFRVTGRSVSVITPHTRKFYLDNGWMRGDIQEEVITALDSTMDFAPFDHWHHTFGLEYANVDSSDGIVDMILMMWRNVCNDTSDLRSQLDLVPGGEASLGYQSRVFKNSAFSVDNGARTVAMGSGRWEQGSGITAIHPLGGDLGPEIIWRYARHEFGHWLLGGDEDHTELGTWGLLDGWGTPSGCMNSNERYKLGWIDVTTIDDVRAPRTISNVRLPDFVTTGTALRLKVPGGGSYEYYLLENHQRISPFDIPDENVASAKGLFVLLQKSEEGNSVGIISAEGRFDWNVLYQLPNKYGGRGDLPVFQRGMSNRINGFSKRERIPWTWKGKVQTPAAIHYEVDQSTGVLHQAPPTIFTGDGKDQFDTGSAPLFTPSSNPSSDIHGDINKVGFEITDVHGGIVTLNIFINTVENASPAKLQDVTGTIARQGKRTIPKITWSAAPEQTVRVGGKILIFRRSKKEKLSWSNWRQIDSTGGSAEAYLDKNIHAVDFGPDSVQYKLAARDSHRRLSIYSDAVSFLSHSGE
jgi:hypothetical protein